MVLNDEVQSMTEVEDIFGNSADTIIFDEEGNTFKISYQNGLEISLTPDRLIDIL